MNPIRTPWVLMAAFAAVAACGNQAPEAGATGRSPATAAIQAGAAGPPGQASDKAAVIDAFERLAGARSYHAVFDGDEVSGQERLQVEYVAPDRLRVIHAEGVQTVIGSDMYLTFEGRTIRQPARAGELDGLLGQWKHAARVTALASTRVESIGSERIDGKDAMKYRVSSPEFGDGLATVWVGDGYPLRIEILGEAEPDGTRHATRMHYSRINQPGTRIDPPG